MRNNQLSGFMTARAFIVTASAAAALNATAMAAQAMQVSAQTIELDRHSRGITTQSLRSAQPVRTLQSLRSAQPDRTLQSLRSRQSEQSNRDALLAADRAFAEAAQHTDLVTAITGMMSGSVTLIALGGTFHGIPKVREALGKNPDNATSHYSWSPLYGEVSADGKTGFTLGFAAWKKSDGTETPGKYVAYWTKESSGWRVLVYKRTVRAAGAVSTREEPAPTIVANATQKFTGADSARFASELDRTERAFSTEAGKIGLGAAFTKNSALDGHHTGASSDTGFRHGPADIGAGISGGGEPPLGSLTWAPDVVYVAATGDIGITFGFINIAAADGKPARRTSYLTVWKRANVSQPWKLAAE